jgi:hypothetical protein
MNELDKVSDKAHDRKSDGDRFRDLDIFCQRMSTTEEVPHRREAQTDITVDKIPFCDGFVHRAKN